MPSHPSRIFVRELSYFRDRAEGLVAVVADGLSNALDQVRQWHPAYHDASDAAIRQSTFTAQDAQLVYARQHGFDSWSAFATYLRKLPAMAEHEPFLTVFEAGRRGEWARVGAVLHAHPDVVHASGTNGNTLVNLAASLLPCPTPRELETGDVRADRLDAMRLLLDAGASAIAANDRGWTPLHQAAYRNDPEMAALLLERGASPYAIAHGSGGTPLAVALFWGHRQVATSLAAAAIVPANLRIAAGIGRPDLVEACFHTDGTLTDSAMAGRDFYRPHSGFPSWRPTHDRQEILDEALVWAAKSDRVEVMDALLTHGAMIDGEPYRGTALVWAAANDRVTALEWLLDHGADVNKRTTFGGLSHGNRVTALHLAAQGNKVAAVRCLLARGADRTITDATYGGTPRGWAEHEGAKEAVAVLSS
ncbi:MAG: ankyrin repeat domain-containing protein [Gemmatimonadaceae bacterium]|nr:ankyrin repeat domain-containing protein [Gemmatimonadaceae bacterium]